MKFLGLLKVVVIGGGTGQSNLLRGLKNKDFDITAIVTVGDDGGSSGRLRKEMQIPPPGDIRNVILSLAQAEPLLEKLFQHRFQKGTGLEGHNVGNLFLAAMTEITGDFNTAIGEMKKIFAVKGNVLPVTNQSIVLQAEMEDGEIIIGESFIPKAEKKIKKVSILPEDASSSREVIKSIEEADMIILGPGSLFTSIIPNLLVKEVKEAISKSKAKKVYVCNVMTQKGETDNFTASDHINALSLHTEENLINAILVNKDNINDDILEKYAEEGSYPVFVDKDKLESMGIEVIEESFLSDDGKIRHDSEKIANILEGIYNKTSSLL